ncbi:clavaminate synthase-like protein At3g21360 isoform X1 [Selaginella moellendorffii]|uniref:clavaminate synthase-like protein At3g21360 isoform X1 n=1 Tax=Selaginella moellendorffii TaxID=88036 RepID=UPI000D1C34C2|nr:clavaminate synthase-like protein At3g21360 isoform X1 [Selaginella moellendorffii]|eukprot:XP_024527976.1 clavaminate synthase-like protein At3g21360 isoform X1 [Selaginella moellendorffii]
MAMAELLNPKNTDAFPLVITPGACSGDFGNDLAIGIQKQKLWLEGQLFGSPGAILFRGFSVSNAEEFARVVEAFGYESMGYRAGAATRKHLVGPVYTNNALDSETELGFHNEMSYLADYPDLVVFFCEVAPPPSAGGATGIVQGKAIYNRIKKEFPEFTEDLENKGLVYYNLRSEESWKKVYETNDRAEAEAKAQILSRTLLWLDDGGVKEILSKGTRKGIRELDSGVHGNNKVWFNSIGSAKPWFPQFQYFEFSDGSKLPAKAVEAALKIMDEEQVSVEWQAGDIVVMNNHSVLHKKHAAAPNTPRKILVSMLKTSGAPV